MGQPSHMVLGIPHVNWPPHAFVLWVVGFLGRPSVGEGGKLLGGVRESGSPAKRRLSQDVALLFRP